MFSFLDICIKWIQESSLRRSGVRVYNRGYLSCSQESWTGRATPWLHEYWAISSQQIEYCEQVIVETDKVKEFRMLWNYRVSHNWVFTLFWLFSWLPVLVQMFILPFFNSPGDDNSKTHLTFLPMSNFDQVTEQNVRQTGFRYYFLVHTKFI